MAHHELRTHPVSAFLFLTRFLYLLLIPLLRGFTAFLSGGLIHWLSGAWLDLLILALMILLAHQKWYRMKYQVDNNAIFYTIGIFYHQRGSIPFARVSTFSVLQPFWLRPLRVVKLRVDTPAQGKGRADLEFYLHKAEAQRILYLYRSMDKDSTDLPLAEAKPRLYELLFLSLFTSNSILGILFFSTFISQFGQLFGSYLTDLLGQSFSMLAGHFTPLMTVATIVFQIPPIATAIALVLLGGWVIAFTVNLLQVKNLHVRRFPNEILIQGGLLTKKTYSVALDKIAYVDMRQSLLTRTLRLHSVFLGAVGMEKERSDISAVIPFSAKRRCFEQLHALLPEYEPEPRQIKPNGGAIMKFILDPLWPCLLIPAATLLGSWWLPMWADFLKFAGWMLSLPAFWWLGVRLLDFFSSGVSRNGDCFTLRYSNLYYLHTVVFLFPKISLINIRQSIIQRMDGKCDVVVSTRGEVSKKHHMRNLGWDETTEMFEAVDGADIFSLAPSLWDHAVALFRRLLPGKRK